MHRGKFLAFEEGFLAELLQPFGKRYAPQIVAILERVIAYALDARRDRYVPYALAAERAALYSRHVIGYFDELFVTYSRFINDEFVIIDHTVKSFFHYPFLCVHVL